MRHSRVEREKRQAELNSAYFVLSGSGGTAAGYGYAMRAIDSHLTGDSHAHWQQKYERRLGELCRD